MSAKSLIRVHKRRGRWNKQKPKTDTMWTMETWTCLKACSWTYRSLNIVYKLPPAQPQPLSDTVIVTVLFSDQAYKDVLHLKGSVFRTTGSCNEEGGSSQRWSMKIRLAWCPTANVQSRDGRSSWFSIVAWRSMYRLTWSLSYYLQLSKKFTKLHT